MIAKLGVCSVAWISQRLPEPLTRVRIPTDPFSLMGFLLKILKYLFSINFVMLTV